MPPPLQRRVCCVCALMGSAGKGLQATGEVPSLTAEELEVVAAAQHAARIAATQPVEKCGSCSHCLDPSKKKACRAVLMQRKELMALRGSWLE